jgi:hypothetical protein
MNLEKAHNRLCRDTLTREQCDGINEIDAQDARRYDQIDELIQWFAELRARRTEKIPDVYPPDASQIS